MNAIFKDVMTDLREKPLLAVAAAALLAALIAVPLLLAKSSNPAPQASVPPAASVPPVPGLPVVSAQTTATGSHPTGHSRDPFAQGSSSSTTTTSATTSSSTSTTTSSRSSSSGGASATGSGTSTSLPTSSSTPPTQIIVPPASTNIVPAALTASQTYDVSLAITNSSGGLDTIDPLERLSVIPSERRPLLVELGVLKGGHRVLFVVQPGAVVNGPGKCTPGPIDCEILSLAPDQTEGISQQTTSGTNSVALFAITAISPDDHGSNTAANQVRRRESAAGRAVLNSSPLSALSLFRYEPSLGVVVDLRNLSVGG